MRTLLKLLLILAILGAVALTVYAYLGDLSPERRDVTEPVILDGG